MARHMHPTADMAVVLSGGYDWRPANNFATDLWPVALGQQIYALALGILYVWLRERSGSLLAPIVTHSLSDFTETGLVFVFAAMLPHA
jgi:hypothetical protein